ncbi:hypothetical protein [Clostridium luticellarii]|uniref:Uncharacterized protein n=1 Tax=Clostridium luticellarii TaxID=1691940 RepID=A0A2T0BPX9_9CLOT|nr:hypothetical protein [Clostridium luticellarii]PRR85946.1 hypothetical protein CLLU_09740 [Clostridium luticellarii]
MKTTANYGLKKPEGTDVVNIDDLNTNADTIDTQLKKINDNAGALSSLNTTAKNTLVAAINEVFQSGADVKSGTISAVNNKGASLDDDATWDDIVAAINAIARGQGNAVESQVLSGIKFSNSDGQLRTGTMPNKGAITITPSGSAQTIPSGYHNGQGKVSAVTVPVANVLSGTTIAGQAGTMPNKGAVTIMPGTADKAIEKGYHNGSGKVKGEPNLTSDNIKEGVSEFGVVGTLKELKFLAGSDLILFEDHEVHQMFPNASGFVATGHQITTQVGGSITITFSIATQSSTREIYGRIYKNNNPVGQQYTNTSGSYVDYTQDLICQEGDTFQLFVNSQYSTDSVLSNKFVVSMSLEKSITIN